jgi:cystine transport system permease protein
MSDSSERLIHIFIDSFWPLLKAGLLYTVPLTVVTFIIGLAIALVTALARLSSIKPLSSIAAFYVWIIRGTPLLVQLFIIFYGLPRLGIIIDAFPSAVIGLSISVGAYNSEIIRAAILSIPKGQWEAGASLGMTKVQILRRVVLPQAVRVSVPPLANSFISLVKDTSLAATITFSEMFQVAQGITARTYEPLLIYFEVAIIYLMFSTVLNELQRRTEKRLERYLVRT